MKKTTFTQTAFGPLPHQRHPALGIDMPVALRIDVRGPSLLDRHQRPELSAEGYLVYVLPGGGRWCYPPLMTAFGSISAALA